MNSGVLLFYPYMASIPVQIFPKMLTKKSRTTRGNIIFRQNTFFTPNNFVYANVFKPKTHFLRQKHF